MGKLLKSLNILRIYLVIGCLLDKHHLQCLSGPLNRHLDGPPMLSQDIKALRL